MINERNSSQNNTPASNNVPYGYPTGAFDLINLNQMQTPNDLYSYYPSNVYHPFGSFDEHNQWASADLTGSFSPAIYPSNAFDYSSAPPTYSPYQFSFSPPNFPTSSPTGTSTIDAPWNPSNLSSQSHLQLAPIQSPISSNKKTSNHSTVPDLLAQQISSINLGNENRFHQYDPTSYGNSSQNSTTMPKSYALVVSSDPSPKPNFKSSPSNHFHGDSFLFPAPPSASTSSSSSSNTGAAAAATTTNSTYPTVNHSNRAANANMRREHRTDKASSEFVENLKRQHHYNPKDFNLNPKGARFFVIKSYSEDDVHRSIKYNIWCSTEHGNKRLDAAFREREGKGPIYLFFSVNASGHFCGMAEMMSPVNYDEQTDIWQMSNKWQGKFEVKWIYVKDVPNQQFRHIRLENNDNKPVTNSRDTQEIPYEKGKLMLKTMHMYQGKTSIFDDFSYYESKQAEEVNNRPVMNHWK